LFLKTEVDQPWGRLGRGRSRFARFSVRSVPDFCLSGSVDFRGLSKFRQAVESRDLILGQIDIQVSAICQHAHKQASIEQQQQQQ
jgi:hypothetical protein